MNAPDTGAGGEPYLRCRHADTCRRRLWGTIAVGSGHGPLPPDTELRMPEFTDLVATAVANAQNRTELITFRARLVAASDEARRRIERDLHDGAQQRLLALALRLRWAAAPDEIDELQSDEIRDLSEELVGVIPLRDSDVPPRRARSSRCPVVIASQSHVDSSLLRQRGTTAQCCLRRAATIERPTNRAGSPARLDRTCVARCQRIGRRAGLVLVGLTIRRDE